jgi:predicted  nucleic acid-binding Zn-ribbon protein
MREVKEIKSELSSIRSRIKNLNIAIRQIENGHLPDYFKKHKDEMVELKNNLLAIARFADWMFRSKSGIFLGY